MNYDEFWKEVERDLRVDGEHLDTYSIDTPYKIFKYIKLQNTYKAALTKAKNEYKTQIKWKRDYYLGLQPKEVYDETPFDANLKIRKADLSIYLDADKDIQELNDKITYYETLHEACEKVIKTLRDSSWNVKHAIEDRLYKQGL